MSTYLFWGMVFVVVLVLAEVIAAKNPFLPFQKGEGTEAKRKLQLEFNVWSWIGIALLLIVFAYVYTQVAGVPDQLRSRRTTDFRQRGDILWKLSVPADRLELTDDEKKELLTEMEDPTIKSFEPKMATYIIQGSWLPVEFFPPKFYTIQVTFDGMATIDGNSEPVAKEVSIPPASTDSAGLEEWLTEFEGKISSSTRVRRQYQYYTTPHDLPGRIKR